MTTWVQPIRHPWFNPPTMKRKLFNDDDDDEYDASVTSAPTTFETSRRKRVRYGSLERTLAHMTLGNALTTTSEDMDIWPRISPPCPRERNSMNVVLPSSVKEPSTPTSEPDDMEVEPSLINADTKMSRSHDWEGITADQLDIKEVHISSAVLDCLRRQTKCPPAPIPLPSQPSQALVLYRAPRPPSEQVCDDREVTPAQKTVFVAQEDDVMEVE